MSYYRVVPMLTMIVSMAVAQNAPIVKPLNIDFKNRAYFYATAAPLATVEGYGGWGRSDNLYQPVTDQTHLANKNLVVLLKPEERHVLAEKYSGFALYVINATNDTLFFQAQDSRLNMKLQAQDKNGTWRDIEYLPSSWCGNSYHQLYLPSRFQWLFTVPEYTGTRKTKIRAALGYQASRGADEQWIYSNEIDGRVNPGQFDKMPNYKPNGIMDPYTN